MQRLFSTFPEGWPGIGLVLLRAVMAIPLLEVITDPFAPERLTLSLELLTAVCSALLIIGLWTPLASVCISLCELSLLFVTYGDATIHIVLAVLGAALAMLGPGAWSVDGRLFGRKRIQIPPR